MKFRTGLSFGHIHVHASLALCGHDGATETREPRRSPDPHVSGGFHSAHKAAPPPAGPPPRALAPVRLPLAFRNHLSLPLGASQFAASWPLRREQSPGASNPSPGRRPPETPSLRLLRLDTETATARGESVRVRRPTATAPHPLSLGTPPPVPATAGRTPTFRRGGIPAPVPAPHGRAGAGAPAGHGPTRRWRPVTQPGGHRTTGHRRPLLPVAQAARPPAPPTPAGPPSGSRQRHYSSRQASERGFIGSAPSGLHISGQKIGNPEMHFSRDELIGSAFIAFGITLFVCFFYVAIVSKLLPPYENRFLAAIQNDWYYCLLVPLTLPVIIVAVYLHWLSMKMFKHA